MPLLEALRAAATLPWPCVEYFEPAMAAIAACRPAPLLTSHLRTRLQVVFIGRHLDAELLKAGFDGCQAKPDELD